MAIQLYDTLSADGETSSITLTAREKEIEGVEIFASGDFDSGTLVLQKYCLDGSWRAVAGSSMTANASKIVELSNGSQVRLSLSGATSPSLYVELIGRFGID